MTILILLSLYAGTCWLSVWFATWVLYREGDKYTPSKRWRWGMTLFMFLFLVALDLIQGRGVGG